MTAAAAKVPPPTDVITIDSSDEDEEDEPVLSAEHRCCLNTFQSIFPQLSKAEACDQLRSAGWNVERAVDRSLGGPATVCSSNGRSKQQASTGFPAVTGKFDNSATTAKEARDASGTNHSISGRCKVGNDARNTRNGADDQNSRARDQLCDQWRDIYGRLDGGVFYDPDFPPISTSIDGRKRGAFDSTNADIAPVRCHCGLSAAPKQVQSDGPNFGRFYLACGNQKTAKATKSAPNTNKSKHEDDTISSDSVPAIKNPYITAEKKPTETKIQAAQKCNFFQWDAFGSKGASGYGSVLATRLIWRNLGRERRFILCRKQFASSHIRQGAVGNCWFLSALAVVAERSDLIRRIMPHTSRNASGCYQVNLFLDGSWQPIIVDSNLPVVLQKRGKAAKDESFRGGIYLDETTVAVPAFCAAPEYQIWAPLVEKAYAKAHGSYQMLSGGFIQEGLQDLTGAPTETVVFQGIHFDKESFWARLLSFSSAGFLMGVATAGGGDGLVGSHAYSVLDIIDLHDCVIGEQSKLTDFFGEKRRKVERTSVRLVRIRNPWGKREWKGEWSATSERWTSKLRARLSSHKPFAKDDGTFFMSYDDMLQRFHHMDIAMTQRHWVNVCAVGQFRNMSDPLRCSASLYTLSVDATTSAIVSIIQPKKRANTKTSSWYCDPCLIICSKGDDGSLSKEAIVVSGTTRQIHSEVILQAEKEYVCLPFSCLSKVQDTTFQFRLAVYGSSPVSIGSITSFDDTHRNHMLRMLHQELLSKPMKHTYPLGDMGRLVCIHGRGCLYFVALNGNTDTVVSVKLTLQLPTGLLALMEQSEFDIPPSTEAICCVVASNGRRSTATQFSFRYLASTCKSTTCAPKHSSKQSSPVLCSAIPLTVAGDLLLTSSGNDDSEGSSLSGGGVIETFHWIPQLGQARFN